MNENTFGSISMVVRIMCSGDVSTIVEVEVCFDSEAKRIEFLEMGGGGNATFRKPKACQRHLSFCNLNYSVTTLRFSYF